MIIDTPEKYAQLQERRHDARRRKSHYLCSGCGSYHHPNDTDNAPSLIGPGLKPNHSKRAINIKDIFPILKGE